MGMKIRALFNTNFQFSLQMKFKHNRTILNHKNKRTMCQATNLFIFTMYSVTIISLLIKKKLKKKK